MDCTPSPEARLGAIGSRPADRRLEAAAGAALFAGLVSIAGVVAPLAGAEPARPAPGHGGPPPGTIFVANAGTVLGGTGVDPGSVAVYRPGTSGDAHPQTLITKGVNGPGDIALDRGGNLWVANESSDTVVEYSSRRLLAASPVPSVVLSSSRASSLDNPNGIAFDPSGNLWVSNGGNSSVVEFTRGELARSGSPRPRVSLANPNLCSVSFDGAGNLWEGSTGDLVSEWTKDELGRSGSPAPRVSISSHKLAAPCRPTFDRRGNLWVAGGDNAVEWSKEELSRSGSPEPKITVSSRFLVAPGAVAVDTTGNLWVPSAGVNAVLEFTRSQLHKSGSPLPAAVIAGLDTGMDYPWAVVIKP